ncbi:MAG TPA: glycosyltransferase family 39 protein [Pirellulales bacterium]|nr:glycosyltransferase family 39 protein [Pirellulales bacterium]
MDVAVENRHSSQVLRIAQFTCLNATSTTRLAIATLVCLTVVVRIAGVGRPLLGHFATKNVMYAMIARNWAMGRCPFWLPTTDCMVGGGRGWHLLEIPLAAYVAGTGWALCGGSLDMWGRAVSVAFSAAGVWLLFLLVRDWHSARAAWAAALVLALSPASIIFGQSFMLEPSLVFFMLSSLWCTQRWLATARSGWFAFAAISLAALLCTKIYMAVLLLPMAALARQKTAGVPINERRRWLLGSVGLAVLGLAPALCWCAMTLYLATADDPTHVYYSLYRSGAAQKESFSLLWSGGFYFRLLCDLAGAGATPVGLVLAALGMISSAARRHVAWLSAMALLVIVLPGKFFELRYYTLVLVPALAVLAGLGWERLADRVSRPGVAGAICLLLGAGCSLVLSVAPAFSTPSEDRAVTAAAAAARKMLAPTEPVATLHGAGCDLLYYCDRPGWALSTNDRQLAEKLDTCRQQGARLLVVADLPSADHGPAVRILATLPIVREGDDYRIYRLQEREVRPAASGLVQVAND